MEPCLQAFWTSRSHASLPKTSKTGIAFRCKHIQSAGALREHAGTFVQSNLCVNRQVGFSVESVAFTATVADISRPFPLLQHTSTGPPGTKLPPGHSGEWLVIIVVIQYSRRVRSLNSHILGEHPVD